MKSTLILFGLLASIITVLKAPTEPPKYEILYGTIETCSSRLKTLYESNAKKDWQEPSASRSEKKLLPRVRYFFPLFVFNRGFNLCPMNGQKKLIPKLQLRARKTPNVAQAFAKVVELALTSKGEEAAG